MLITVPPSTIYMLALVITRILPSHNTQHNPNCTRDQLHIVLQPITQNWSIVAKVIRRWKVPDFQRKDKTLSIDLVLMDTKERQEHKLFIYNLRF